MAFAPIIRTFRESLLLSLNGCLKANDSFPQANTSIIPTQLNLALGISFIFLHLIITIVLPLWSWAWCLTAILISSVLLIFISLPLWGLIHEGIHRLLAPNRYLNELVSTTLAISFGASLQILRFAHLMHHQHNRQWESEYFNPIQTSNWKKQLSHYFFLLGGVYIFEFMFSLIGLLLPQSLLKRGAAYYLKRRPEILQAVNAYFFKRNRLLRLRLETILIVALYGSALWLYGEYWYVLLSALYGRALIISLFDNLYHYGTPANNSILALELVLPCWLEKYLLHGNYHATHHQKPNISWYYLTTISRKITHQSDSLLKMLLRQFAGPLLLKTSYDRSHCA